MFVYFNGSPCLIDQAIQALFAAGCPAWAVRAYLDHAKFAREKSDADYEIHHIKTGKNPRMVKRKKIGDRWDYKELEEGSSRGQQPGLSGAVSGGGADGGDGGNAGAAGNRSARPRIITARPEYTKTADTALVPAALRQHLISPDGSTHQLDGAALAIDSIKRYGGFLNADGTGAGKTRQELSVAQHFLEAGKKVIIVSPAEVIKPNWKKGTMSGSFASDAATMGLNTKLIKGPEPFSPGTIHITTYNELGKLGAKIDKNTIVIFDESHKMRNRTSQVYKNGKVVMEQAGGVMYATATPADKPLHIAHLARAGVFGDVGTTKTYEKIGMRLVDQHTGGGVYVKCWQVDPSVGYQECARRISGLFDQMTRDGLMIKRELSMDGVAVGIDRVVLPAQAHEEMRQVYEDTLDRTGRGESKARDALKAKFQVAQQKYRGHAEDAYRAEQGDAGYRFADLPKYREQAKAARQEMDKIQAELDATRAGKKGGNKAVALMAARLHQEPYKIPFAVDAIKKELAEGRSPVVFIGRVNDIITTDEKDDDKEDVTSAGTAKALKKALIEAGIPASDIGELHGGATKTPEQKKKAMDSFQANKTKIIIATIQSGGVGINLDDTTGTRPRTAIVMTPPFTANDMAQLSGRIVRLNTRSASRIRGILGDTAIDDWNAGILANKFRVLGAIVGGESTTSAGAINPADLPDIGEATQPFEWGASLHTVQRHYFDTPFPHNQFIGRFGGKRVMRQGAWTTEFPSKAKFDEYAAHVAANRRRTVRVSGDTFTHRETIKAAAKRVGGQASFPDGTWHVPAEAIAHLSHLRGLRFSDPF